MEALTTKIRFTHNGKSYALEYTRDSVKEMERRGFVAAEILEKPLTVLPELFAGAFIANHRFVSRKKIDEIFTQFDDKCDLLNALAEMYSLVLEEFVAELEQVKNGLPWERS